MNPLLLEYLAEEHRKDLMRELANIRLQKEAAKSNFVSQSWFSQTMQGFGQWLIVRGERLVKRYEMPANYTSTSEQKYAH